MGESDILIYGKIRYLGRKTSSFAERKATECISLSPSAFSLLQMASGRTFWISVL